MQIAPDKTLEELFKSRLSQLKVDSEQASGAITQHVRAISYGMVALVIPFVTSEPGKLPMLLQKNPRLTFFCATLGFLAVLADVLQNYFSRKCATKELDRIVQNLKLKNMVVDSPTDFLMTISGTPEARARTFFYRAKIVIAALGVLSLTIIISNAFL